MFGCRTAFGGAFCSLLVAVGCGGAVAPGGREGGSAGVSQAGSPVGRAGSGGGGSSGVAGKGGLGGRAGAPMQGGSAGMREPDPIDTECPTQPAPPPDLQCDPF